MFMEMRLDRRLERLEGERRRLATRTAVATLTAIALAFAGVIASATVVHDDAPLAFQALATAPLPASVVTGAWAIVLRRRAQELRRREAEVRSALDDRSEDPSGDLSMAPAVSPADLIAIERILRAFYEAPSGRAADKDWGRFRALFARGALLDSGREWVLEDGLPVDAFVALARGEPREVWLYEVERTLHVLGDVAVALSAFESRAPEALEPARGVNVLRLRKGRGTWKIEGVTSRALEHAATIRRALAPTSRPPPPPRAA